MQKPYFNGSWIDVCKLARKANNRSCPVTFARTVIKEADNESMTAPIASAWAVLLSHSYSSTSIIRYAKLTFTANGKIQILF